MPICVSRCVIDVHVKLQELTNKLIHVEKEKEVVEKEKQEMHDSYNAQRAKFQTLYVQKEAEVKRLKEELDDAKTQLCIAELNAGKVKEEVMKAQADQIAELTQVVQGKIPVAALVHLEWSKCFSRHSLENRNAAG